MSGGVPLEKRLAWRERPNRAVLMHHVWKDLAFIHWTVPPDVIQASLPQGLTVDTWEGQAYLGLTPFFMRRIRPRGLPPVPWLSNFLEMNVRTYVYDAGGNPGVWFYSLDCSQPIAVWLARTFMGLPYRHATMKATREKDGTIAYSSERRGEKAVANLRYRLKPTGTVAAPGTLEFFLLERYLLFTVLRGRLLRGQVHHAPYPVAEVELSALQAANFGPGGVDFQSAPAHIIGSEGVKVEVFGTEPAGSEFR
jgi:uncharacterized protein YqjF (DUF2071 family)